MKMFPALEKKYTKEQMRVLEAQRLAHEIAFAPVTFQVSRLMVKFGIFQLLSDEKNGLTLDEIVEKTDLSRYAVQVLLESSLTIGTVIYANERFELTKAGWFLLTDPLVSVNMRFNHDVNYLGMFNMEEALLNGKPEGLKVFGQWKTIYEGLSSLPEAAQKSWFDFDHFYSDNSFDEALEIVFSYRPSRLLDVGGNTGRWALRCVDYNPNVHVTIMDLPQQIALMEKHIADRFCADRITGESAAHTAGNAAAREAEDEANRVAGDGTACDPGHAAARITGESAACGSGQAAAHNSGHAAGRITGHGANLLDENEPFPKGFDAIWMSQFLDCFSEAEVTSIIRRAADSMDKNANLFIMETLWDRQPNEIAAYCLTQISLYFSVMANGNSKMYHSEDMIRCIEAGGLKVRKIHDGLKSGHSILVCGKE